MARVLADVRADTSAARREAENRKLAQEMGEEYVDNGLDRNDWRSLRDVGSLELPEEFVQEGVRLVKESLEQVVGCCFCVCVVYTRVVLCAWANSSGYSTARSIVHFKVDEHRFSV